MGPEPRDACIFYLRGGFPQYFYMTWTFLEKMSNFLLSFLRLATPIHFTLHLLLYNVIPFIIPRSSENCPRTPAIPLHHFYLATFPNSSLFFQNPIAKQILNLLSLVGKNALVSPIKGRISGHLSRACFGKTTQSRTQEEDESREASIS